MHHLDEGLPRREALGDFDPDGTRLDRLGEGI
jgi:hypothetical protein